MHIVHVLSVSLWGGPSQAVVNLLADGARRGWRMSLILLERRGGGLERLRSEASAWTPRSAPWRPPDGSILRCRADCEP